mgnify:CR=1 FL=1
MRIFTCTETVSPPNAWTAPRSPSGPTATAFWCPADSPVAGPCWSSTSRANPDMDPQRTAPASLSTGTPPSLSAEHDCGCASSEADLSTREGFERFILDYQKDVFRFLLRRGVPAQTAPDLR